jgi:hypothetical protein
MRVFKDQVIGIIQQDENSWVVTTTRGQGVVDATGEGGNLIPIDDEIGQLFSTRGDEFVVGPEPTRSRNPEKFEYPPHRMPPDPAHGWPDRKAVDLSPDLPEELKLPKQPEPPELPGQLDRDISRPSVERADGQRERGRGGFER